MLTRNEHVADASRAASPHEVERDVTARRPRGTVSAMHNEVRLLADLDGPDAVRHADGLRSGDGGEFEGLVRPEGQRVHLHVACEPCRNCGYVQHVDHVSSVRGVAAECHPSAAGTDLCMASDARHALAEAQVCPRAVGERSAGVQHGLHLCIVEPHSVRHHAVPSEHTELLQVQEWPASGALEIPLCIARTRRHMEREPCTRSEGQFAARNEQFIGHEVVARKGDPALHEAAAGEALEYRLLAVDQFGNRAAERHAFGVPAPRSHRTAQAHLLHRCTDTLRVSNGARLDHRGGPGEHRLDGAQQCTEPVVVGRVRVV